MTILSTQLGHVSELYSKVPEVQSWIYNMLLIYLFAVVFDMLAGLQNTTLRVANRTTYVAVIVSSTFVVL